MNNGTFDFNLFIAESKETLLNPKSYFSTLKTTGGIVEPLIKAAIYGTIAGIIAFLWSIVGFGGVSMFGSAVGITLLFTTIIGAVVGLFIGGVILLLISTICKGNTDFEANVRVTASLMVLMPISALLGFTSGINLYLGLIVGLSVQLYSLWLLYNALIETLKGKPETVKIVSYVLIGLLVLVLLGGMSARNRASRMFNDYNKDARELLKDLK